MKNITSIVKVNRIMWLSAIVTLLQVMRMFVWAEPLETEIVPDIFMVSAEIAEKTDSPIQQVTRYFDENGQMTIERETFVDPANKAFVVNEFFKTDNERLKRSYAVVGENTMSKLEAQNVWLPYKLEKFDQKTFADTQNTLYIDSLLSKQQAYVSRQLDRDLTQMDPNFLADVIDLSREIDTENITSTGVFSTEKGDMKRSGKVASDGLVLSYTLRKKGKVIKEVTNKYIQRDEFPEIPKVSSISDLMLVDKSKFDLKQPVFGFFLREKKDGFYVSSIIRDSVAHKAGIQSGEELISVSGIPVAGIKQTELFEMIQKLNEASFVFRDRSNSVRKISLNKLQQ